MRIAVACILTFSLASASYGAEFRNFEAPGNLESKNDIGCVGPEKLSNTYTPADLYKAVSNCASQDKYVEGVYLFALAGVYGRFDTFRVSDKTAHQAVTVLVMQSFGSLSMQKKDEFKQNLKKTLGTPEGLAKVCKKIDSLGPPNYYPRYMVQHGMGAFDSNKSGNGLVADFDAKTAWKKSLDTYLHCQG